MVSNNEKKIIPVCIKARSVESSLLAAVYKFSISKSKDWKTFTPLNNQYNKLYHEDNAETNHSEEMELSASYS